MGSLRLPRWIDVQDDLGDFLPIRTFGFGIEEAEVGNGVRLVVARENG